MPNEFQTIQEQLAKMEGQMTAGFAGVKKDIQELKEEQEKHFTAIKMDLDSVQSDVQRLDSSVQRLESDVQNLKSDVQRIERVTSLTLEIVQGERDERVNLDGRVGILEEDMVTVKEKVGLKVMNHAAT